MIRDNWVWKLLKNNNKRSNKSPFLPYWVEWIFAITEDIVLDLEGLLFPVKWIWRMLRTPSLVYDILVLQRRSSLQHTKQSKWSTRLRVQGKLHGIVCFDDIMRMIIILQNCHCGRRLPVQFHLLNPKFHWLRQIRPLCASFTDSFGIFLDAIAKAKKLICISIAQNLKQVSLTKRFFSLCNGA